MALPKLETKTYTLTLPSTGEEIKYRPFLMKEQKTLLMAQESKDDNEVVDAMSQLINDCTFEKVDSKTCPLFDAEYIFLKLRSKSVGEKVKVSVICPDDKKTRTDVEIDLGDIECNMLDEHTNTIKITDSVEVVLNYPLLSNFQSTKEDLTQSQLMFNMVNECIHEIHFGEDIYNKIDMSEKDVKNLSTFWEFDDAYTAPIHGFTSAKDYYTKSSSKQFLKHIKTNTLVIHSLDDPFTTPKILPSKDELSKYVELEVHQNGGHVGFIDGTLLKPKYWLEERIVNYFNEFV